MTKPRRIQRQRQRGWRAPAGAIYVGRPTRWANPFAVTWNGLCWQVIDTGDRSLGLREEPQTFTEKDKPLALAFATSLFELHTGPMGLYEYDADMLAALRAELGGRDLMCWCPLPAPGEPDHCHAAVLLDLANQEPQ